jgi:hypothetical protein
LPTFGEEIGLHTGWAGVKFHTGLTVRQISAVKLAIRGFEITDSGVKQQDGVRLCICLIVLTEQAPLVFVH